MTLNNSYHEHYSVLLDESIASLNIKPNGIYVDCTLGRMGHAKAILEKLNEQGRLIGIDRDAQAIAYAQQQTTDHRFKAIHAPFSQLKAILTAEGITQVDGILFDLGVSSPQLDDPERGFSFHHDARLDMRMDTNQTLDAHYIINHYSQAELLAIFQTYGAEKYAHQVTKNIIQQRSLNSIDTTLQLVDIIKQALPTKELYTDKHPARVYFQAIRIAVNNEFKEIEQAIHDALNHLGHEGRLVVISFHSLENAIVKQTIKQTTKETLPSYLPIQTQPSFKMIKAQPVSQQELMQNKRSRSAKLHIVERNLHV